LPTFNRSYRLAVGAGFAFGLALGLAVLSRRFDLSSPSMVDDWYFAGHPAESLAGLIHPFLHPVASRFRPAWNLWGELEWHTFGAPDTLTGPNLWGGLRVVLFVAGALLVPAVVAATSQPRPRPVALAVLVGAMGLLLFSGPSSDVDLFRLGPTEPVLVGAMSCGAALLLYGTGRLIDARRHPASWAGWALPLAALGGGLGLWLLGVYHKEASVTFFVLAPFLYRFLRRRWRQIGRIDRPLWRYGPFQVTAALMLLPLVHIAVVTETISGRGASLYGASPPHGISGWAGRAIDALSFQWSHWAGIVGTGTWRIAAISILVLLAASVLRMRKTLPWLPIGLIVTGWAALILQGFPLHEESRYYIPSMVLFGAAALLLLAQSPGWLQWTGAAAAVALAVTNVSGVRNAVDQWSGREKDDARAAGLIALLHPASCPVYMNEIDIERSEAMPRVLSFTGVPLRGPCRRGAGTIIVGLRGELPVTALGTTKLMRRVCARQSILETTDFWQVTSCRKLRRRLNGRTYKQILRPNRLVPGLGPFAVHPLCVARYGRTGCGLKGGPE
jgi:hypothetical protein